MANEERILTYMGFNEERPFSHYLQHLYRFWEAAMQVMYHIVVTDRRVVLVRTSNPFESVLIGPLLIDGLFYFPRLRWFKDRVLEGKLEKALETNLKKETYAVEEVASLDYDRKTLTIRLKSGRSRSFKLQGSRPMSSIGGDFPHKASFASAAEEFNRLAATRAAAGASAS